MKTSRGRKPRDGIWLYSPSAVHWAHSLTQYNDNITTTKNDHYADHQMQTSNIGEVVDKKAARSNYWQPQVWAESAVLEMPPFQSIAQFTLSLNLHFIRQFKFLLFFNLYFESLHSVCLSLICYSGWLLMFTKQIRIQIFSENSSEIHFVCCTARWNIECISLKRLLQQMKSWQFDILWHKQKGSAKSKSLLALADVYR